jgi:4'-phosphopantetheinyl transferase
MNSHVPKFQTDQVHVWAVRSLSEGDCIPSLYSTLSPDELQRAAAFRFEKHKNHYIAARGLLRAILGGYVGKPAEAIEFKYGPHGKPYLCGAEKCRLQFNLSHSEDCTVYAVTRDRELGIDVERIKELPEMDSVARRFFSQAEGADLRVVPSELRAQAFYNCWTRKEAYIKAVGSGLSLALDQFRVSLLPDQPAALLSIQDDADAASCWTMHDLHPWDGFVAALAIPSPTCSLLELKFANARECLKRLQGP